MTLIRRAHTEKLLPYLHQPAALLETKLITETDNLKLIQRSYWQKELGIFSEAIISTVDTDRELFKTTLQHKRIQGLILEDHPRTHHDYVFVGPRGLFIINITTGRWTDLEKMWFQINRFDLSPDKLWLIGTGGFPAAPQSHCLVDISDPLSCTTKEHVHFFGDSSIEAIKFERWHQGNILECTSEVFEACDPACEMPHRHYTEPWAPHKLYIRPESITEGRY